MKFVIVLFVNLNFHFAFFGGLSYQSQSPAKTSLKPPEANFRTSRSRRSVVSIRDADGNPVAL